MMSFVSHSFLLRPSRRRVSPYATESICYRIPGMRQRIRGPLSPHCCQDNLVRVDVSLGSGVGNFVDLETIVRNMENDASKLVRVAMHEAEAELSILLCTDAHITTLNDKWRHISTPTDVLSFPQDDDVILGDIAVSIDTAARQAAERDHSLTAELRILLLHGLLHLLGYDHETSEEDMIEMAAAERTLMTKLEWDGVGLISTGSLASDGPSIG